MLEALPADTLLLKPQGHNQAHRHQGTSTGVVDDADWRVKKKLPRADALLDSNLQGIFQCIIQTCVREEQLPRNTVMC